MAGTRGPSKINQLVNESRDAALNAVQTYNNPLATFKSETFIVLMTIAWTYLLHAYLRRKEVEYRYYRLVNGRRRFDRTKSGAYKHWELERCLNDGACPLDSATKQNLRFLIGLRHEIEHHQSAGADKRFATYYLACILNYEEYLRRLFGERYSIGKFAEFALQFGDLNPSTVKPTADEPLPFNIAKYVSDFNSTASESVVGSPQFRRRFLFVPITVNHKGQADHVIEFVRADSELAKSLNDAYHQQVVLKETEKPKYLPGRIVELMKSEGYTLFGMFDHTKLWQSLDAKNPGKGLGVQVAHTWFWYDNWVELVRKHCADNVDTYQGKIAA